MPNSRKSVLLLQPSKFQALVWRLALSSQQISVLWGPTNTELPQIISQLDAAGIKRPDLLLVDLEVGNAYEICQWCREYCPNIKVVLTSALQQEISPTERQWAIHQGAEELLTGFQEQKLLKSVVTKVRRVLEILNGTSPQETALIQSIRSLYQDSSYQDSGSVASRYQQTSPSSLSEDNPSSTASLTVRQVSPDATAPSSLESATFWRRLSWLALLVSVVLLGTGLLWSKLRPPNLVSQGTVKSASPKTFESVSSVPQGLFNYGGSTTWAPIRRVVNPQLQEAYPEFELRYVNPIGATPGSGTGIRMLLDGQLDFSQSSRSLKEEEYAAAQERGFTLVQRPVAIDGIAVAVHPSLSLPSLSIEQLRQIYLGEITNWQQVGGSNLAIAPLSRRPEDGGTVEFFRENILQDQSFGSNVTFVYSTTDGLRQLSNTPGGIYYASAPEIVPQCTINPLPLRNLTNQLVSPYREPFVPPERCPQQRNHINSEAFQDGSYPITRKLFVIVKQQEPEEQAGEAYTKLLLTDRGQQLIEEAGFVPLR